MHKQKPITDLKHRYDVQGVLKCLWAIKDGDPAQFMAYGESWIEKVVKQQVDEGIAAALRSNSTFKISEVFKEAYTKHGGDMEKVATAMGKSPRTCFRYKKLYIDTQTVQELRKKKYANKN